MPTLRSSSIGIRSPEKKIRNSGARIARSLGQSKKLAKIKVNYHLRSTFDFYSQDALKSPCGTRVLKSLELGVARRKKGDTKYEHGGKGRLEFSVLSWRDLGETVVRV